ncbi:MAG: orotidine-5'-phosphate decarboxylase [Bdellovibrionota bacterium]
MSIHSEKVIVALDQDNFEDARSCVEAIGDQLAIAKVGSILYSACGAKILEYLSGKNVKIFLDLKYHDIPNTVAGSIRAVLKHAPIELLTVHSSGGAEMIRAAKNAIIESKSNSKTKLLSVTILTSLDEQNLISIGYKENPENMVVRLAKLAHASGTDGVVCSSSELDAIRKHLPKSLLTVVPGIRLEQNDDDQKRVATPRFAFDHGADYIVVGRPITESKNPAQSFQHILKGE